LQSIIELFIVKIDYKNLIGFLIIKELNWQQVRWAEMLVEYYFKIEHIKGIDNARADILSRKVELQGKEKIKGVILRMDNNSKIRYNYPQLIATQEKLKRVYKSLKSF